MIRYRACGQIIESEIPLRELSEYSSEDRLPTFSIRLSKVPFPEASDWFHRWVMPDGSTWLQIGRQHGDYLLRFPSMADFLVQEQGSVIGVYPGVNSSDETIRHLLLDQVLPAALAQAGKLVLHASAVLLPGGIAAFMGQSGKGKSTLAASFCEAGYRLVTDDCLVVEERQDGFHGVCSYPGLRLWQDSADKFFAEERARLPKVAHYSEKVRIEKTPRYLGYSADSARIDRMYLLEPDDNVEGVRFHRVSGARTVVTILEYVFHLDVKDPESLRVQFEWIARVAKACPVYRLSFPTGYEHLDSVRTAVLNQMGNAEVSDEPEERLP